MDPRLDPLFSPGPVLRSAHTALSDAFDRALRSGAIVAPFPGVYHLPSATHGVRAAALLLADPMAVLTHESAAHAHGWCAEPDAVRAASVRRPRDGYVLSRRRIPPELVARSGGIRRTSRALTALDLALEQGPSAIDDALRRRVPLEALREALALAHTRHGNARLRRLLDDSRSAPWSAAERAGHQGLRDAGVRGWVANHTVRVDPDTAYFLDIAFRSLRLGIEIDGWEHHGARSAFDHDRLRDVALARIRWQVVRFPAPWVLRRPVLFGQTVAELAAARADDLG